MSGERAPLRGNRASLTYTSYQPGSNASGDHIDLYQEAAWYVEDAFQGFKPISYAGVKKHVRNSYLFHQFIIYNLYYPALMLLMALTFFEAPVWCNSNDWMTWAAAKDVCHSPDGSGMCDRAYEWRVEPMPCRAHKCNIITQRAVFRHC